MTILLVSDIPDHLPHYTTALRRAGYVVVVVNDAEDARAQALAHRPVAMVIDERVAGQTGWELCKRLKADLRLRPIPVVMIAGAPTSDALSSVRSGCDSWLTRPTTADDLLVAVQDVVKRKGGPPVDVREAVLGLNSCRSCRSDQIRAAVRIGAAQYYFCEACGLYWRESGRAADWQPLQRNGTASPPDSRKKR